MDPEPVDTEHQRNQAEPRQTEPPRAVPSLVPAPSTAGSPKDARQTASAETERRPAVTVDARQASHRALVALRRSIRASPLSQRRIEQHAGFSKGYLSQLLAGNLDLKLRHILGVLEALGIAPGQFFAGLYPGTRRAALTAFRERRYRDIATRPSDMDAFHDLGIESLAGLRQRLERCERVVDQLEGLGIVSRSGTATKRPDP